VSESLLRVAIALGSNLHDRYELLASGTEAIRTVSGVSIIAASSIEETSPDGPPQPNFLNQMLLVETELSLAALLAVLHRIEHEHGRERHRPKGPRTLDLDIVWAQGVTITTPDLLVPHPGLVTREFWHHELAELLGVVDAADAIASAQIHAGKDTAGGIRVRHEHRWSGNWETIKE
jgi:2-amino-4-hydroxy-6-hydroxymethyldihydropteridine diphosphokinase